MYDDYQVTPTEVEPAMLARPTFYLRLSKPVTSRVLMVVLLVGFLIEIVYGVVAYDTWMTFNGTDIMVLVDLGAKVNILIAAGEYWRLFTATLLHGGILHLLFNLYALFALGPLLEAYVGPLRFLAIYMVAGLYGSLASYAFADSISVGASGAIFGIVGATTVYFFRYRDNFGAQARAVLQNMVVIVVINLVFGLSAGNIDNWGHMGGLAGGALAALGLLPRYRRPAAVFSGHHALEVEERRLAEIGWVFLCFALFAAGVYVVTQNYQPELQQFLR